MRSNVTCEGFFSTKIEASFQNARCQLLFSQWHDFTLKLVKPNEKIMKRSKANEAVIEIVNDLIKINNDRIKGYEKAIENTEILEAELKTLYARMAEESYQYNRELSDVVTKVGGQPANAASGLFCCACARGLPNGPEKLRLTPSRFDFCSA